MQTATFKATGLRSQLGAVAPRRATPINRRLPLGIRCQAAYVGTETTTSTNGASTNGYATPAPIYVQASGMEEVLSPADAYAAQVKDGVKKGNTPALKTFIKGLYAGAYIGFGGFLGLAVVNACPGIAAANPGLAKLLFAAIFPCGLYMTIMTGVDLFTGNTMKMPAAVIEKKVTMGQLWHNWFWSYSGNFVGSLALVAAVAASGVLAGSALPIKTALYKSSLTWSQAFIRAILANWLVCVAVWCAGAATSLPGKILGLWPPICAFVAIGLEHSVANMFLIPMGIALGADITFNHFLTANLIPVTLGNIVGGMVFMGFSNAYFFGSLGKKKEAAAATA